VLASDNTVIGVTLVGNSIVRTRWAVLYTAGRIEVQSLHSLVTRLVSDTTLKSAHSLWDTAFLFLMYLRQQNVNSCFIALSAALSALDRILLRDNTSDHCRVIKVVLWVA
jgi:hypothetical protein